MASLGIMALTPYSSKFPLTLPSNFFPDNAYSLTSKHYSVFVKAIAMTLPNPLSPRDAILLRAAEGWIELGDHKEARAELVQISPEGCCHPEVLKIQWLIFFAAKNWNQSLEVARQQTIQAPADPDSWLNYANSLYATEQINEALQTLLSVQEQFPSNSSIHYNLACYSCLQGRFKEAMDWLNKALKHGDAAVLRKKAVMDKDLEAIWKWLHHNAEPTQTPN